MLCGILWEGRAYYQIIAISQPGRAYHTRDSVEQELPRIGGVSHCRSPALLLVDRGGSVGLEALNDLCDDRYSAVQLGGAEQCGGGS
jgi:hypothetical protein